MNAKKLHAAVEMKQSRSITRECRPVAVIVEVPESQADARRKRLSCRGVGRGGDVQLPFYF